MENIENKENINKEEESNKLSDKLQSVINTFIDFFGEEHIDIERHINEFINYTYIYVWFPKVTITNEKDEFTEINDLYVKVKVSDSGLILDDILMTVTTYTKSKWNVGYMHSHLNCLSNGNVIFKEPCLGTGPLKDTIYHLKFNYDIEVWEMFCLELSKYVQVESIEGLPYMYLSKISMTTKSVNTKYKYIFNYFHSSSSLSSNIINNLLDNFIIYLLNEYILLSNHFIKLINCNYLLDLGEDYIKTNVKITNMFIKYIKDNNIKLFNDNNVIDEFFIECNYRQGKLYTFSSLNSMLNVPTQPILQFKGKPIYVKILEDNSAENTFYLLNNVVLSLIINKFLLFLNINENGNSIKQFLCI